MRVYIPFSDNPSTGKGLFCSRLSKALVSQGIEVVSSLSEHHDVSLHVVHVKSCKSRKVVRLDGIYHNTEMDYKQRNRRIQSSLTQADGVVYQSRFSKRMADRYVGKVRCPSVIINNGANCSWFDSVSPCHKPYQHMFIAANRWRPHKRLEDIVGSFQLANIQDSGLWIAGSLKHSGLSGKQTRRLFSDPRVIYLGSVDQLSLASCLVSSTAFIHLCWIDWCPNSVVEAIAAGVPVVTNNVGGTQELVRPNNGFICEVDNYYDLSPVKLYHPPKIDRRKVADILVSVVRKPLSIDRRSVDIGLVAVRYLKFFGVISEGA